MLSSALGDRLEKFSQASKRMADGEVDPGRKTDTDDAGNVSVAEDGISTTFLLGTFWTKSHVSGPMMRIPSGSVTANVEPE